MELQKDGSMYWEKSDMRDIKDGNNEYFKKIDNISLEELNIVAYEDTSCDRPNAILFSTRKDARGANHMWWYTGFDSKEERDLAISHTYNLAESRWKHTAIKLEYVAPQSMVGRGYRVRKGYSEDMINWEHAKYITK
jgi:hypothetical protein